MCTLLPQPYDRQLSKLEVCVLLSRRKVEKQSAREWTVLLLRVKGCRHHSGAPPSLQPSPLPKTSSWIVCFSQPASFSQCCGLGLSAYQGCFHSINMKENIVSAIQEHERANTRQSKFKQIKDISTESNQKKCLYSDRHTDIYSSSGCFSWMKHWTVWSGIV